MLIQQAPPQKQDVFHVLTTDLSQLAEKVDVLRNRLNGVSGNGALQLLTEIDQSLQTTIDHFCIQEYEIERTLEKWLTLKRDLELARLVQHTIFPHESLIFKDHEFSGFTRAARTLGGDYYTYGFSPQGVYAAIGDVSGKGIANALITIIINNHIKQYVQQDLSLEEIMIALNQLFGNMISDYIALDNKFMTFLLFRFNGDYVEYAGAGHEYMLIYRAETQKCERIKTGGVALGLISDFLGSFSTGRIHLNPGDSLITYSDGVTEARNNQYKMYGLDRLEACIAQNASGPSTAELVQKIAAHVDEFQGTHEQYDDITLMVIKSL